MEVKIEDYLDKETIREIVIDELRSQIKEHFRNEENAKRLLSNLAYHIVREEVEKIVPNYEQELVDKVASLIKDKSSVSFNLFDFDSYGSGRSKSLGAKIVEQTVQENRELIKEKVIQAIQEKDYSDEALLKLESISENFSSNIYDFVELMRSKK
jgi:cysteinyl-tRNA synthetase